MKKCLPNFASKNVKVAFYFNAIPFFLILIFKLIFPLRTSSKNNNFKAKTTMFRMKYTCGQIFNKFADFISFENA